ncbi:MAG: uridine kinase [Candidatus Nanopelagicales bacterium]
MVAQDAAALATAVLAAEPRAGDVRLVCIDGPSGAGKTTLAAALAAELEASVGPVPVVHGDDVYEGWDVAAGARDAVQAFGILGDVLVRDLVQPWMRGEAGVCRTWDWHAAAWGAPRAVPAAPVVLLEGVGLAGSALRPCASLVVWLDADPAIRAARVADRDGAEVDAHMDRWRAREDAWHAADRTAEHADVRIATG